MKEEQYKSLSNTLTRLHLAFIDSIENSEFLDERGLNELRNSRGKNGRYRIKGKDSVIINNIKALANVFASLRKGVSVLPVILDPAMEYLKSDQKTDFNAIKVVAQVSVGAAGNFKDIKNLITRLPKDLSALSYYFTQVRNELEGLSLIEDLSPLILELKKNIKGELEPVLAWIRLLKRSENSIINNPELNISLQQLENGLDEWVNDEMLLLQPEHGSQIIDSQRINNFSLAVENIISKLNELVITEDEMARRSPREEARLQNLQRAAEALKHFKEVLAELNQAVSEQASLSGFLSAMKSLGHAIRSFNEIDLNSFEQVAGGELVNISQQVFMTIDPFLMEVTGLARRAEIRLGLAPQSLIGLLDSVYSGYKDLADVVRVEQSLKNQPPYWEHQARVEIEEVEKLKQEVETLCAIYNAIYPSKNSALPLTTSHLTYFFEINPFQQNPDELFRYVEVLTGYEALLADIDKAEGSYKEHLNALKIELNQFIEENRDVSYQNGYLQEGLLPVGRNDLLSLKKLSEKKDLSGLIEGKIQTISRLQGSIPDYLEKDILDEDRFEMIQSVRATIEGNMNLEQQRSLSLTEWSVLVEKLEQIVPFLPDTSIVQSVSQFSAQEAELNLWEEFLKQLKWSGLTNTTQFMENYVSFVRDYIETLKADENQENKLPSLDQWIQFANQLDHIKNLQPSDVNETVDYLVDLLKANKEISQTELTQQLSQLSSQLGVFTDSWRDIRNMEPGDFFTKPLSELIEIYRLLKSHSFPEVQDLAGYFKNAIETRLGLHYIKKTASELERTIDQQDEQLNRLNDTIQSIHTINQLKVCKNLINRNSKTKILEHLDFLSEALNLEIDEIKVLISKGAGVIALNRPLISKIEEKIKALCCDGEFPSDQNELNVIENKIIRSLSENQKALFRLNWEAPNFLEGSNIVEYPYDGAGLSGLDIAKREAIYCIAKHILSVEVPFQNPEEILLTQPVSNFSEDLMSQFEAEEGEEMDDLFLSRPDLVGGLLERIAPYLDPDQVESVRTAQNSGDIQVISNTDGLLICQIKLLLNLFHRGEKLLAILKFFKGDEEIKIQDALQKFPQIEGLVKDLKLDFEELPYYLNQMKELLPDSDDPTGIPVIEDCKKVLLPFLNKVKKEFSFLNGALGIFPSVDISSRISLLEADLFPLLKESAEETTAFMGESLDLFSNSNATGKIDEFKKNMGFFLTPTAKLTLDCLSDILGLGLDVNHNFQEQVEKALEAVDKFASSDDVGIRPLSSISPLTNLIMTLTDFAGRYVEMKGTPPYDVKQMTKKYPDVKNLPVLLNAINLLSATKKILEGVVSLSENYTFKGLSELLVGGVDALKAVDFFDIEQKKYVRELKEMVQEGSDAQLSLLKNMGVCFILTAKKLGLNPELVSNKTEEIFDHIEELARSSGINLPAEKSIFLSELAIEGLKCEKDEIEQCIRANDETRGFIKKLELTLSDTKLKKLDDIYITINDDLENFSLEQWGSLANQLGKIESVLPNADLIQSVNDLRAKKIDLILWNNFLTKLKNNQGSGSLAFVSGYIQNVKNRLDDLKAVDQSQPNELLLNRLDSFSNLLSSFIQNKVLPHSIIPTVEKRIMVALQKDEAELQAELIGKLQILEMEEPAIAGMPPTLHDFYQLREKIIALLPPSEQKDLLDPIDRHIANRTGSDQLQEKIAEINAESKTLKNILTKVNQDEERAKRTIDNLKKEVAWIGKILFSIEEKELTMEIVDYLKQLDISTFSSIEKISDTFFNNPQKTSKLLNGRISKLQKEEKQQMELLCKDSQEQGYLLQDISNLNKELEWYQSISEVLTIQLSEPGIQEEYRYDPRKGRLAHNDKNDLTKTWKREEDWLKETFEKLDQLLEEENTFLKEEMNQLVAQRATVDEKLRTYQICEQQQKSEWVLYFQKLEEKLSLPKGLFTDKIENNPGLTRNDMLYFCFKAITEGSQKWSELLDNRLIYKPDLIELASGLKHETRKGDPLRRFFQDLIGVFSHKKDDITHKNMIALARYFSKEENCEEYYSRVMIQDVTSLYEIDKSYKETMKGLCANSFFRNRGDNHSLLDEENNQLTASF